MKEIIPAVEALRGHGISFLKAPGAYYDRLPERLEKNRITNVKEPIEALRNNHILVDGADDKYMLQIFMLDAMAMYGDEKAGPFSTRSSSARATAASATATSARSSSPGPIEASQRDAAYEVIG